MHKLKFILLIAISICLSFKPALRAEEQGHSVISLSKAVEIAVANHASIKTASEIIVSAAQESKSAWAEMFPKMSVSYSYTKLDEKPFMRTDMAKVQIADTDQYHWDLTLVQPLFAGFALTTRHDMAKIDIEVKKQEKRQAVLDLIQKVKTAYFNLLLTEKMLFVAEDAVTSLVSHESDSQKLYDHGVIRLNDLLRAKVALANVKQDRERARSHVKMAVSDLNRWMGYDINRAVDIEDIDTVSATEYQLGMLTEKGMKNRPILKVLDLGVKTLGGAIKLEKSAYYPKIALIGSYQQDGDDPGAADNDFSNDHNTSLTLQARWTFFESGKKRAKVQKARHDRQALVEKIKEVEDSVKLEIKYAWLDLGVAQKNIETSKASLGQAKENWRITNLGYKHQVATSTEVLDARTDLTQADSNYYQALYGYLIALADLKRSIGESPDGAENQTIENVKNVRAKDMSYQILLQTRQG